MNSRLRTTGILSFAVLVIAVVWNLIGNLDPNHNTEMLFEGRVCAVTGANKGIGLAIVRRLALDYQSSPFKAGPLLIYLTARSPERGAEAVETLNKDSELKKAKVLTQDGGNTTIKYHALDISQSNSIKEFRDFLQKEHPEGIDAIINNAGIRIPGTYCIELLLTFCVLKVSPCKVSIVMSSRRRFKRTITVRSRSTMNCFRFSGREAGWSTLQVWEDI